MSKIVWDIQEMYGMATSIRHRTDELNGVASALARDLGQLGQVEAALGRYGIRLSTRDAITHAPARSLRSVATNTRELGQQLGGLVGLLNEIEDRAQAVNGTLFQPLPPQLANRVANERKRLLADKNLPLLLRLRTALEIQLAREPAMLAAATRRWLQLNVPDAKTRAWVVENSPDVARLLAENVDEGDATVRELRALTVQPGSRPFDHFLSLSPERREWLAIAYPSLIGDLDGAPADMHGAANRVILVAYREKLFDDLSQSQLQGYRVANRDERSIELRLQAIDWLLGKKAGNHILAFDRPDMLTQMKVVVDEAALKETSPGTATRLMYELARQAGTQQGYSQALLKDLDSLSQSKDPAVARFGRETAYDIRTTGRIDAGKAADLLGKADYPLAIFSAIANAGERIEAGQKPPAAVINAFGQTGAGVGTGLGAHALCVAAGPGAVPCALIGVGAGITAEELYQLAEDGNTYAFTPAPGDEGSVHRVPVAMAGPEADYDPSKYFVPLPPPQSGGPYPALP